MKEDVVDSKRAPAVIHFYDYSTIPFFIQIFSGFVFVKRTDQRHLFCTVTAILVTMLDLFILTLCVMSIIFCSFHKRTTMKLLQFMITSVVTLCIRATFAKVLGSFHFSEELFKSGVYKYDVDDIGESDIVKDTLDETKRFLAGYRKITWFTFFVLSFLAPLLKYLFLEVEDTWKFGLNPYLPFPVYMPFDTHSALGYIIGLTILAVRLVDLMSTGHVHAEVTMAMALQFSAQIKVLNFSLQNIKKRAMLRFKEQFLVSDFHEEGLYYNPQFQDCLYFCLRENVLHDQMLVRLKESVCMYLEATNSVSVIFCTLIAALALYAGMVDNNFEPVVFVLPVVFGVLHMNYVGQYITDVSSETKNAAYATPWYNCKREFNSLLKVLLVRSQEPLVLHDICCKMKVSLESFGNMASGAYKLVSVLR